MIRFDLDEVRAFIRASSETSGVYVGSDSFRHRRNDRWMVTFVEVVVVHRDCSHGARIFGRRETVGDFPTREERLRREMYRAVDLWLEIKDSIGERPSGLHIDFNTDPRYPSACMVNEAIGYVLWHTGKAPIFKPDAFAASAAADRLTSIHRAA